MPNLFIDIEARFAKFQDSLDRVERSTQRSARTMERAFSGLKSAFAALVPAVTLGSIVALTRNVAELQDELGKLSQKVGVSVESLSALKAAGELSDVSLEQLGTGLRQLAKNMADTRIGTGEAQGAFKALGIEVVNSSGQLKDTEQVLLEIADRFAGAEDGAGKTAIAMRLFGRAGADLIPLLNQGSEGLRSMREEAERFGLIISKDAAQASEAFNDNLTRLGQALDGLKIRLGGPLISALNDFLEQMLEGARIAGGFWRALALGATINPFKEPGENIRSLTADLERLERRREILARNPRSDLSNIDRSIERVKKQIELEKLRQRQEIPRLPSDFRDERSRFGTPKQTLEGPEDLKEERARAKAAVKRARDSAQEVVDEYAEINAILGDNVLALQEGQEWWKRYNEAQERAAQVAGEEWVRNARAQWEQLKATESAADSVSGSFEDLGLVIASSAARAVQDWSSARDVLRGIVGDIAAILLNEFVTKRVAGGLTSLLGGLFGGSSGPTPLQLSGPFATGGSFTVGGDGGTDSTMVAFRATRGERVTVSPPGRGGEGAVTVNVNLSTGVAPTVRAELMAMLPEIQRLTTAAVADARRRGGSFAAAFGA